MSEIETNLKKEIDTWLPKAKTEFQKIKSTKDKDFLIRGIGGEIYPIKKEVFYKAYGVLENGLKRRIRKADEGDGVKGPYQVDGGCSTGVGAEVWPFKGGKRFVVGKVL